MEEHPSVGKTNKKQTEINELLQSAVLGALLGAEVRSGWICWQISTSKMFANHSITAPLYLNTFGRYCKQQTRFAADPWGNRNVWSYTENLEQKVCTQSVCQAGSVAAWLKGGGAGKTRARIRPEWETPLRDENLSCWSRLHSAPPLPEIYQQRKWHLLLFSGLIWSLRDLAPREGSVFPVQAVISD